MTEQLTTGPSSKPPIAGFRPAFLIPVLLFAALAIPLGWGLTQNPGDLPSTLISKPVPDFALPPIQDRTLGFASVNLKGSVSLVNVFASWCVACRAEHPIFMRLKEEGIVAIHGINYKDRPEDAARWLGALGDPYTRTGADRDGRVGIDWGVYGAPETFVIDREGRIAYKHIGAVTPEVLRKTILPVIERPRRE